MNRSIWIGWDPRESAAFAVARQSARRLLNAPIPIEGVVLDDLRKRGLYTRPTEKRLGRLWDVISEAPMSTEFAVSRFLVPRLAGSGWALFMDCDVLVRANLVELFCIAELQSHKAVLCVKHDYRPTSNQKMDGAPQTTYARKNWSSVCLWNVDHPANATLTAKMVNSLPGRDLHRFCWLDDNDIGELGPEWNYLVGHTTGVPDPKIVHFTDGYPLFTGFENVEYAEEWRAQLHRWAA